MRLGRTITLLACALFAACGSDEKKLELNDEAHDAALELCAREASCHPHASAFANEAACGALIETELKAKVDFASRCGEAAIAYERCVASVESCGDFEDTWTGFIDEHTPCVDELNTLSDACSGYGAERGDEDALVESYCELEARCYPDDYDSPDGCIVDHLGELDDVRELGAEHCERALVGLLHCLSALSSCEELEQYWDADVGEADYPCAEKDIQLERYCDIAGYTPTW